MCAASAKVTLSARHHAAESREASLSLSDQWMWSQIQQAAVIWNKETLRDQPSHPTSTETKSSVTGSQPFSLWRTTRVTEILIKHFLKIKITHLKTGINKLVYKSIN